MNLHFSQQISLTHLRQNTKAVLPNMKPSLVPTRSLRANIITIVIISDLHFYRYLFFINDLWLLAHLSNFVLRTRK